MAKLALYGGHPTVTSPAPHFTWPKITPDVVQSVVDQLHVEISIADASGVFRKFETAFADYHSRKYSVLYNSGTSGLYCAFYAANLGPSDSVVVPDYTFFATASPLVHFPVDIRFADCDANGNVTANTIEKLIDSSTRLVVITHMWGIPCEIDAIAKLCKKKKVLLIEDCSHAHGARYKGRVCGSFGDMAVWSIQGQKIISGGEGGVLVTDSRPLYERAVLAGHYGKRTKELISEGHVLKDFRTTGFGLKLRAHPVAVAIAVTQLGNLDEILRFKRAYAAELYEALSPYPFITLPDLSDCDPSWYNFPFLFEPSIANESIEWFYDALIAEGCCEVDRPGSTRNISKYALFSDHAVRGVSVKAYSSNASETRHGAESYYEKVLKLPVWASACDRQLFCEYKSALIKVCESIGSGLV